jgi:GT2 family glycosyltransferase
MDVSIIIVNYNTKDLTLNCLKSVFAQTKDLDFEVFVSDNASTDGSVSAIHTAFPEVKIIENDRNIGFGAANNRALSKASGKYVFYLNSDTILLNNAIKIFFDYWEESNEKLGVIGTNLLTSAYTPNQSFGYFPTLNNQKKNFFICLLDNLGLKNIVKRVLKVKTGSLNYKIGSVDYVMGADMFLLNEKDAYFDEDFFMYFEETDLQKKMAEHNKLRLIIEGPKIIHLGGGSTEQSNRYSFTKKTSIFYWKSCLVYLKKRGINYSSLIRLMKLAFRFLNIEKQTREIFEGL